MYTEEAVRESSKNRRVIGRRKRRSRCARSPAQQMGLAAPGRAAQLGKLGKAVGLFQDLKTHVHEVSEVIGSNFLGKN